jgi:hypothetical protein
MASHPSFTTVADIYLAGKIQNISPKSPAEPASSSQSKQAPVSLTEQEVAQYQGTFQESDGTIWKLAPKEGKLEALVQGFTFQLVPMSRTHFVAVASLNTSELLPYAGEYYSEELDSTYKAYLLNGQLQIRMEGRSPEILEGLEKNHFKKGNDSLKFDRSSSGTVSGFDLEAEALKSIPFS